MDEHGLLAGIDFASLKREFRGFIDTYLDHQCLLNKADPFAQPLFANQDGTDRVKPVLPGLRACEGDPTTENIAAWIGSWAQVTLSIPLVFRIGVEVEETPVNAGTWSGSMHPPMDQGAYCLTDILGRLVKSEERHPKIVDEDANLLGGQTRELPYRLVPRGGRGA